MRYIRISDTPCQVEDCPAVFCDRENDRRAVVRGDLLPLTDEITLEQQEAAVCLPVLHLIAAAAELGGGLTRVDFKRMMRLFAVDAFRIETVTTTTLRPRNRRSPSSRPPARSSTIRTRSGGSTRSPATPQRGGPSGGCTLCTPPG